MTLKGRSRSLGSLDLPRGTTFGLLATPEHNTEPDSRMLKAPVPQIVPPVG